MRAHAHINIIWAGLLVLNEVKEKKEKKKSYLGS